MCGVNGVFIAGQGSRFLPEIEKMNNILRHRGPNDEGVYSDNDVVMGHRRLSIIDLSQKGRQPLSDSSESVWVTCNGEIYNYKELRKHLQGRGHSFRSDSDTEVIIYGYKEWGAGIFERLEGMFAFALWDKNNKQLYLVRDGCGVKPLFYFYDGQILVWSSEIKGLLASGLVERNVDLQALSNFLSLSYIPNPHSILKNVCQVAPGTSLQFSEGGHHPVARKYWGLENVFPPSSSGLNPEEFNDKFREEISIAVKSSLVSDVPISLLLSSGLDSSIILEELKRCQRHDVESITIGFDDPSYDERGIAKRFATDRGFINHSILMTEAEIPPILEKVIYHLDALNANPCILAEYLNFKKAAERFQVTLMGTGCDEILAGYSTYKANALRKKYGCVPLSIRKLLHRMSNWLPVSHDKYSFDYLAFKFTQGSLFPKEKSHYCWRTMFSEAEKSLLLNHDVLGEKDLNLDAFYIYEDYYKKVQDRMSFEDQTLYTDFNMFLIDNGNIEVDQLSMAFGLEARPPFLTKRFVEFAFGIPFDMKLKNNETKYCMRQAYRNILPSYIVNRKKEGFLSPLDFLFKKDMDDFIGGYLLSKDMEEYFNKSYIEKMLHNQRKKIENNSYKLFTLLCFAIWQKLFLKNSMAI
jgi:asparagine synthase (glutamine-hydrolysing)